MSFAWLIGVDTAKLTGHLPFSQVKAWVGVFFSIRGVIFERKNVLRRSKQIEGFIVNPISGQSA